MRTVIYTRKGWVKDNLPGAEALKDHPLWVADFQSPDTPRIPAQWAAWTFWQFTETGTVPGVGSAISPSCGTVTVKIYTEKEPEKAESKVLDRKTVDRVWCDFATYRTIAK
jgi:hypothetical protein